MCLVRSVRCVLTSEYVITQVTGNTYHTFSHLKSITHKCNSGDDHDHVNPEPHLLDRIPLDRACPACQRVGSNGVHKPDTACPGLHTS